MRSQPYASNCSTVAGNREALSAHVPVPTGLSSEALSFRLPMARGLPNQRAKVLQALAKGTAAPRHFQAPQSVGMPLSHNPTTSTPRHLITHLSVSCNVRKEECVNAIAVFDFRRIQYATRCFTPEFPRNFQLGAAVRVSRSALFGNGPAGWELSGLRVAGRP